MLVRGGLPTHTAPNQVRCAGVSSRGPRLVHCVCHGGGARVAVGCGYHLRNPPPCRLPLLVSGHPPGQPTRRTCICARVFLFSVTLHVHFPHFPRARVVFFILPTQFIYTSYEVFFICTCMAAAPACTQWKCKCRNHQLQSDVGRRHRRARPGNRSTEHHDRQVKSGAGHASHTRREFSDACFAHHAATAF